MNARCIAKELQFKKIIRSYYQFCNCIRIGSYEEAFDALYSLYYYYYYLFQPIKKIRFFFPSKSEKQYKLLMKDITIHELTVHKLLVSQHTYQNDTQIHLEEVQNKSMPGAAPFPFFLSMPLPFTPSPQPPCRVTRTRVRERENRVAKTRGRARDREIKKKPKGAIRYTCRGNSADSRSDIPNEVCLSD